MLSNAPAGHNPPHVNLQQLSVVLHAVVTRVRPTSPCKASWWYTVRRAGAAGAAGAGGGDCRRGGRDQPPCRCAPPTVKRDTQHDLTDGCVGQWRGSRIQHVPSAGNLQRTVAYNSVQRWSRAAVVGLDWDNVSATDILAIMRSFCPGHGNVTAVRGVYPKWHALTHARTHSLTHARTHARTHTHR